MSAAKRDTKQIKSKERVARHGEVFTAQREVNAMLDLVSDECLRAVARFLEPACGDGNFLAEILKRKLSELRRKYRKSHRDYEKQAIVAISSLYGVDILNDNVQACRKRLFDIWNKEYTKVCKEDANDEAREAARFIIGLNIVNGNALTLTQMDADGNETEEPIVFSEWALISGDQMQRSDYTMSELVKHSADGKSKPLSEDSREESGVLLHRYISNYKKVQDHGE